MKLTQILKELKWQASTLEMCMNDMVPLSLPIIKQMVETKRATAFHITDVDNLPKLVSMEGKSKSISAFNKTADMDIGPITGAGMWTKGGILVLLSGIVLAESVQDLWTKPDESGRRWVEPKNAFYKEFSEENKIIDFAPQLKPLKEKWEKFTSSYNQIHKNQPDLTNDEKLYFIKTYIDTAYKLMLKNKKSFQDKYINSTYLSSRANWNEIVLNKIKVELIAVIEDSKGMRKDGSLNPDKELINSIKNKYQNVEVIKLKDIPSFMKKYGVLVVN
jgi:hypothetical protein